jgi:hypothetical protein
MTGEQSDSSPRHAIVDMMALRVVSLLLLVAAISVFTLWSVNPVGSGNESTFALFLAVDLVSVAMISYVQRSIAEEGRVGRVPLIAGCCFILFLVAAGVYLLA